MKRIINDLQINNPVCGFALRCFLLVCFLFAANTPAYAQTEKVTINVRNVELSEVFTSIQNQTGLKIFYNNEIVNAKQKVTVNVTNLAVDEALKQILGPLKMNHSFVDKTIVVTNISQRAFVERATVINTVTGVVRAKSGAPLPGATVRIKMAGTLTDAQGRYAIAVPADSETLTVSYVGMVTQTLRIKGITSLDVTLEEEPHVIEEMIVTGYVPKAKNSFTGTAVQVKGEELRTVNPTNLLSALKVFDPSFIVVDQEGTFGSNPNYIPERIDIRGQSSIPDISKGTLDTYTSLPIFILDGFQITVQQVFDLNMNRIKSVTILKDAAASAIYGSRAANGVVVIETTVPDNGKLSISYALNVAVESPDLSSYNLMNSSELLEYFRRLELFNNGKTANSNTPTDIYENLLGGNPGRQNLFMLLSKEVENGVDTYWLSQPLRTALRHDHTVMLEGGTSLSPDEGPRRDMRYQVTLNGSQGDGVMKGSKRDRIGGGLKLFYDTEKLRLVSNLQFSKINNADSPYGNFSTYANLFPFYRMTDSNGELLRMLSYQNIPIYEGFPKPDFMGNVFQPQSNPLYEAKFLSSFNKGETTDINYNMGLTWFPLDGLRVAGAFSLNNVQTSGDRYRSPLSPEFYDTSSVGGVSEGGYDIENLYKRGTYTLNNRSDMNYTGRVDISYLRSFNRHTIQAVAGGELTETNYESDNYTSVGFLDDPMGYPSYAIQFKPDSGPGGSKGITRSAGAYLNMNYSWSERYLVDLMGRLDGSSNFASQKRTAPFWSTGVRWNIHNESFMKNSDLFQKLALKASIGTTGNQNFQLSQIMMMYRYLGSYNGVLGADIMSLANESLKWQTALKRNVGIELSMLEGRVNLEGNIYRETTKDNLTDIKILASSGFSTYKANQGDVENKGFEIALIVTPIRTQDWILSLSFRAAHNQNKLMRLSDALKEYNESVKAAQTANGSTTQLDRIFLLEEGKSLNTIYAVRSLGIDPATGQEIYLTRNGEKTFTWNAADQVAVGVDEPKLKGSFGFNLFYKRWQWNANFEYSFGADRFNTTLYDRMEGANFSSNLDRRALTERWTKPGDIAKYRSYTNMTQSKISSRFVQRENYLSLTSMNLTYKLIRQDVKYLGLSDLTLTLSTNELFYTSTVKRERGLSYPFARTFNFTLRANF